jgi:hypothetical protein
MHEPFSIHRYHLQPSSQSIAGLWPPRLLRVEHSNEHVEAVSIASMLYENAQVRDYLERELAEVLMRTKLPQDFNTDDLRWRRRLLRIMLPEGPACP